MNYDRERLRFSVFALAVCLAVGIPAVLWEISLLPYAAFATIVWIWNVVKDFSYYMKSRRVR